MAVGFTCYGLPVLTRKDLGRLAAFPVYPLEPTPAPGPEPAVVVPEPTPAPALFVPPVVPDDLLSPELTRWGEDVIVQLSARPNLWQSFGEINLAVTPRPGTGAERKAVLDRLVAAGRLERRSTRSAVAISGEIHSYRIRETPCQAQ